MEDIEKIEQYYQMAIRKLPILLPEGISTVNLEFLKSLEILDFSDQKIDEFFLSEQFKMVETSEKVTIISQDFLVWIIPSGLTLPRYTHVLIALNKDPSPQLETGFIASGVYNNSRIVVRVLERVLMEIKENEELMDYFHEVI